MRRFPIALILFSLWFLQEPSAAQASPVFLHALSDSELAQNSAGRSIVLHVEETMLGDHIALTGIDASMMRNLFGIQTIVFDSGASSTTEATTSLTLRATLTN